MYRNTDGRRTRYGLAREPSGSPYQSYSNCSSSVLDPFDSSTQTEPLPTASPTGRLVRW